MDDLAIRQSLRNLILGYVGCKSRLFNQTFGSQTYQFLQEPMDVVTAAKIKSSLMQAIQKWEPRVRVNVATLSVEPTPSTASYLITVTYQVLATSKVTTAVYNLKTNGN